MEQELAALEGRLEALLALCSDLRAENHALRAQLAQAQGERGRLAERIETARTRLESLFTRLPA